jgi:phosphoenolpyruvate phosphomutase
MLLEFMSDATTIPILHDADTGYGDYNIARRLVRKLEMRDIAGLCLEDKIFPKINTFIDGKNQRLTTIEEFCSKIKAIKDTQKDSDFVVVARTEAFTTGSNLDEALLRAYKYKESGADAILVHSKQNTAIEIEQFMESWDKSLPIIIVPTKYYNTPTEIFRKLGISCVIWANHNIRASINGMKFVGKHIFRKESISDMEKIIASMDEVFRLQNMEELLEAEKKYL